MEREGKKIFCRMFRYSVLIFQYYDCYLLLDFILLSTALFRESLKFVLYGIVIELLKHVMELLKHTM